MIWIIIVMNKDSGFVLAEAYSNKEDAMQRQTELFLTDKYFWINCEEVEIQ